MYCFEIVQKRIALLSDREEGARNVYACKSNDWEIKWSIKGSSMC